MRRAARRTARFLGRPLGRPANPQSDADAEAAAREVLRLLGNRRPINGNHAVLQGGGEEQEDEEQEGSGAESDAADGAAPGSGSADLSLLEQANLALADLPPQVQRARALMAEALQADPDNIQVLDALGALLCDEEETEEAKRHLLRSVELEPNVGAEKFLYLAQMSEGKEALEHFTNGASVLKAEIAGRPVKQTSGENSASSSSVCAPSSTAGDGSSLKGPRTREQAAARRQLAEVQASIAELWMTDLCDEECAEDNCDAAVVEGLEADASNLQLLTAKATLLKVRGSIEDAKKAALDAAETAKAAVEAAEDCELVSEEEDASNGEDGAAVSVKPPVLMPDEDSIASLTRVLIDLGETQPARELLCGLLERDEEDLRVWVLLGWCHVVEKDPETALDVVKHGFKLCKKHGEAGECWKAELRQLLKRVRSMPPGTGGDGACASGNGQPAEELASE